MPELQFVQVRHEEMAAFMACGHAKFTGQVGVCLATSGPGAIHLLNGLYDAQMDHQPVVAIVGQQERAALGGDYQQEVDLATLFKDVAHEFVHMATSPVQIRQLVDRAIRIALSEKAVTCLILPKDVDSKFRFITVAAQRAKQLQNGAKPRVELRSRKPTRVAMQEVLAGAVSWEMRDEVPEK